MLWSKRGVRFVGNCFVDAGMVDWSSRTNNCFCFDLPLVGGTLFDQITDLALLLTVLSTQISSVEAVQQIPACFCVCQRVVEGMLFDQNADLSVLATVSAPQVLSIQALYPKPACFCVDQPLVEALYFLVWSQLFYWRRYRPRKQLNKQLLLRQSESCLKCMFWSKSGVSFVGNCLVDAGIVDWSSWANKCFYVDQLVAKAIAFHQDTYISFLATVWSMQVLSIEAVEWTTVSASINWLLQV